MKRFAVAMTFYIAITAVAGPLGLSMGMSLEDVKRQGNFIPVPGQSFMYKSATLTKGHPNFDNYLVTVTPEHGLCKILASGKDVVTNVYGSQLQSEFKKLVDGLSAKYGPPDDVYDFLNSGSIWNDEKDWMTALVKKERVLEAFWGLKKRLCQILSTKSRYLRPQ